MTTKKFKTNIKCSACVEKVTPALNETAGEGHWSVDLTNPQRILSIEGDVNETKMKEELGKVGYRAEKIND
jgi:copper chaperone